MPLVRRVPKRGFNNKFALTVASVNVSAIDAAFEDGSEVTPELMKEKNLAKQRYDVLKVLGDGEITKKLKISAHRFSKSAREKIEKAGGEVIELKVKTTVAEKVAAKKGTDQAPEEAPEKAPEQASE